MLSLDALGLEDIEGGIESVELNEEVEIDVLRRSRDRPNAERERSPDRVRESGLLERHPELESDLCSVEHRFTHLPPRLRYCSRRRARSCTDDAGSGSTVVRTRSG
jgi:hypothetical protein